MTIAELEEEARVLTIEDIQELQFALAQVDLEEESANRHTEKIRVLCLSLWYPLSMSRYFEDALKHNPNVDLKTTGVFTGSWIPWLGGMNLKEKYAKPVDLPLPFRPDVGRVNYDFVKAQLPKDWTPDVVLCIDAGITWEHRPSDGYIVHIGTDPHVLNYSHQRGISDKFFSMQLCYKEPSDIYLPYAYSPRVHYPEPMTDETGIEQPKTDDAVLIGMPYTHVPRAQWIDELRKHGVSVIAENGPVFDEYRELANRARIGLNWSSMNDLNARFFENPAFGLAPVNNRVPDAHLFLDEGKDYIGFDNLNEAIEGVLYLKNNPDKAKEMARNAYNHIQGQTYDSRVNFLLRECGF
jgi:hypothetical protein